MNITEVPVNATLYIFRSKDIRNKEWEHMIYLTNPRSRTNGCGFSYREPVPFLKALGIKVLENKKGYPYYAIGCTMHTRDPLSTWYRPPPPVNQLVQDFYLTLPLNKMFKTILIPRSGNHLIEWMKEGITGVAETEAFE